LEWRPLPDHLQEADLPEPEQPGHWLILADSSGTGRVLADALQARGHTCSLTRVGEAYASEEENYSINPTDPEHFVRLSEEVLSSAEQPWQGIVHLWSLDAVASDELTLPELEQAQTLGCASVLHLAKALLTLNLETSPKLWLCTRGAQAVGEVEHPLAVAQTPLWGFGRSLGLEHPGIWGGMLDLDPSAPKDDVGDLFRRLESPSDENQLAWREGRVFGLRLMEQPPKSVEGLVVRHDRTYLVTGGLGALGMHVARWLVEQGAQHLLLMSRRVPSEEVEASLQQWRHEGAQVVAVQADVGEANDLRSVFTHIEADMPPLAGVIHAAGMAANDPLQELDWRRFEEVMRAKVMGAWLLHEMTREQKLDFFVGFSSIASVWGSTQQTHYGAANQFLDGLAHHRRTLGLPGTSINWGPWREGGMVDEEAMAWLRRRGVEPLQTDEATTALGMVLANAEVQTTVANVNWNRFKPLFEAYSARALLSDLQIEGMDLSELDTEQASPIRQEIETAPVNERTELLLAHLKGIVTDILGLGEEASLDVQQGFADMGMDSLMAMELRRRLEVSLGCALPPTLALEYPTFVDLVKYLSYEALGWESEAVYHTQADADSDELGFFIEQESARIERMTEESMKELIDKEIQELLG
jgi:NAD(P)-dependent dehydrogenase (short-subunit alcohol dehydrogenase family)/acyl carrier protein